MDQIKPRATTMVNVPSGTEPNPYTNYPFRSVAKLADYVQDAHRLGARVNLDYNTGELSNHCAELWATEEPRQRGDLGRTGWR